MYKQGSIIKDKFVIHDDRLISHSGDEFVYECRRCGKRTSFFKMHFGETDW
jgi:hypothetical protein